MYFHQEGTAGTFLLLIQELTVDHLEHTVIGEGQVKGIPSQYRNAILAGVVTGLLIIVHAKYQPSDAPGHGVSIRPDPQAMSITGARVRFDGRVMISWDKA